jgi:predicted glycoside hydrolase/deacetylase ChbG (UPF0249 family)
MSRSLVHGKRSLIVTADDFGIGPATSQGILDLAVQARISAAVLLVNSPYAQEAVQDWRRAAKPMELGWHPCLTLDGPVLPPNQVPSLVDPEGMFWPLGKFIGRLYAGRVSASEIRAELTAQYHRFVAMVGNVPTVINSHHHVQVFPPIGAILCQLLASCRPPPYIRRVREPWWMLTRIPGARLKRLCLSLMGRRNARGQTRAGFPGNDWLAGITDPPCVEDPEFLTRWLSHVPGRVVELTCHPGYLDATLIGRDCTATDGQLQRRVREWHLLHQQEFEETCRVAGFLRLSPSEWLDRLPENQAHAA